MTIFHPRAPFALGVIILAAGRSDRMGRPKLLLRWGETTIIGHLIHQWRSLGASSIRVVIAQGNEAVTRELDRLGVPAADRIVNPEPEQGMFSSIQCAAREVTRAGSETHFTVVLGDQPQLRLATLRHLVEFAAGSTTEVCQPSRLGRPKHPVVLSRTSFENLAQSPLNTLKDAISSLPVSLCECEDPGLEADIDTPGDYERARRLELERKS
jgi:molybdenum cofactor cytidylyltransferase